MKNAILALICFGFFSVGATHAQTLVKRTLSRSDKFEFAAGGTLSITGAPNGSIKIVGTNRNEIEIAAEVELSAPSEGDLAVLGEVTGFIVDKTLARATVITSGTHNKLGDKNAWKKFPKKLLGLPFRVDYTISVPRYADLEIDGGNGDLEISGVEGSMRINFLDTRAKVKAAGSLIATFGSGSADIVLGPKGWRARSATVHMGSGDLTIGFPANTSADIDANVLTTGRLTNDLTEMKPRDPKVPFTDRSVAARLGVGGTQVKLAVGQGTLRLTRFSPSI